jgi:exonuclease SbcC
MRPARLALEGFTSFRQPVDLDFEKLDLFAITGATGSGKTSLIDAILFALYGRTPRISRGVTDLISQGSAELKILFEFHAGLHRYRAFRHIKRKGPGKQRLDQLSGDEWTTLSDSSKGVDFKVRELLGLDFDGFTKTVVLPQGEFDKFLRGEASKRREILIELLGLDIYARMMRKANESANQQSDRAKLLEDHVNRQLAGQSPERIAELESQLATAREQIEGLQQELDRVNAAYPLQGRIRELRQLLAQQEAALAEFMPITQSQMRQSHALETARKELEKLEQDAEIARSRHQEMESADGSPDLLRRKAQDIRKAVARQAEIVKQKELLAKMLAEFKDLNGRLAEATMALKAAEEAHIRAIQDNAADQLREHLQSGEECPVCEQLVLMVPAPKANSTVEEARKVLEAAQKSLAAQQAAASNKTTQIRTQEIQIKLGEKELLDSPSTDKPEIFEEKAAVIEAARDQLRKLDAQSAAQRKFVEAEKDKLNRIDMSFRLLEQKLATLKAQLAGAENVEALEQQIGDLASRDLEVERKRLNADLQARQRLVAQAETAIEHMRKLLEESEAKRAEIRELQRSAEVARKLGTLLQENRFQTFVLSQTLRRLATEGTRQLKHLSSGRYSFATEGDEFLVVDHWNADEKRSVNTLSGGESFLASLSLALALSKSLPDFSVNRDAIRLDSLFLDEGFSTLDSETMQIVLDAIELLQVDGRMIGVVSHIPELAERLPARIEVTKSPGGSTVAIR